MNRDLGAEDYVEFRLVDTTGSLTQLISLHGREIPFSPGADPCKFPGNLSSCFLPLLANGSGVKCLLCISWLFVTFGINIYQQVLFIGLFWAAFSPVSSKLMPWFLTPALRDMPLSWKVSVVCSLMQNAWNDLISESLGMPQSRLCHSHWLLNLREGAWAGLPGLAQFGWHHVPFPAHPHHFSLNYSLSHLSSNHRADLFFVLGIWHYHCAVSIQKCLTFPMGLLSGCQWGTSTAKGVVVSLCMATLVGLTSRGCAVVLPFCSCYLTTRTSHGICLSSLSFFPPLFFSCPRLKVRCKVIVSKDNKVWPETGHFRSSR